jgi:hypothetical protein
VLLKFLLLERQRIALADVPVCCAPCRSSSGQPQLLRQTPEELGEWAAQQLIRAGAARVEGEYLLNHEM